MRLKGETMETFKGFAALAAVVTANKVAKCETMRAPTREEMVRMMGGTRHGDVN